MRLARAMKRKAMRSAQIGEKKGRQDYSRAKKAVRHATTREIVMQTMIRKEFAAEITATVFVAMRRTFGWARIGSCGCARRWAWSSIASRISM